MTFAPTAEQLAALDAVRTGGNVVIEAGAGTGKTSTLQLIARDNPSRRGLYVAFNKAIATEAQRKFAGTGISARTVHSLAFNAVGRPYGPRLSAKYMFWHEKAKVLGVHERFDLGPASTQRFLAPKTLVRLTTETVDAFCRSSAEEITPDLIPLPEALVIGDESYEETLRRYVARLANRYWDDLRDVNGRLPFKHDTYLKLWQLSRPVIDADLIMFDEAQDADPLMTAVIGAQANTQLAVVGDPNQAIYGWRGAVDAMNEFGGIRTQLTQSFRFGQAIADEANFWLEMLDSDLRLTGHTGPSSVWKSERQPEAILTRSNVGAIREVLESQRRGKRVGIAGANKARELDALAKAALDLQQKGQTNHPDLDIFNSWNDVVTFSQMDDGTEIAALVNVIEEYTAEKVIAAIAECVPAEQAEQTISTAHIAKGLEWFHVRIANDFHEPGRDEDGEPKPIPREEARLAYVASTRAQRHLDASGLDWAKDYAAGVAV